MSPADPVYPRQRWPVTLGCSGSEDEPHEDVTWLGSWLPKDAATATPGCWVCGGPGHPVAPVYPYVCNPVRP